MYRHSAVVRVTHWINALCLVLLLMSGLRIFNYHPSLYWGNYGYAGVPSFISIGAIEDSETDELDRHHPHRRTGASSPPACSASPYDPDGDPAAAAFPNWITLPGGPGLALARDWHFAMAWLFAVNGAVYLLFGLCPAISAATSRRPSDAASPAPYPRRRLGPRPAADAARREPHAVTMCCRSSPISR